MAAGTVISGGFPGRVAQEVQPNPKCNGCLHFDGQAGRIGACTIGSKPWNCGDGDAADIGYAPIARGAGKYLGDMSNHGAHAPEVGDQEASDLTGSGSVRPVTFQQVSLGEEHVHFAKSYIAQHDTMQKSMCRLCKSTNMLGTTHSNIGPQVCTCETITAQTVAKALAGKLNNLERSILSMNDLVAFVYACAKSNFDPAIVKGTFYHQHGKYEVHAAGGGDQHVDFHPRGGGKVTRVATVGSHREARRTAELHAKRFAAGTGTEHGGAPMHSSDDVKTSKHKKTGTPPGLPSMKDAVSVKSDDEDEIDKSIDNEKHSHIVTGKLAPGGRGASSRSSAHTMGDKLDSKYGASAHSVTRNPNYKPKTLKWEKHGAYGAGAHVAEAGHGRYIRQPDSGGGHNITYAPHGQGEEGHTHGGHHSTPEAAHAAAQMHHDKQISKSLSGGGEEWVSWEKSLRWSHKTPGAASTSHGKYTVHANESGGHTVTYTNKETGKSHAKTFASHREALGAVTEHHLKNRPPPKKRGPKKPKAEKPAAGGGEAANPC